MLWILRAATALGLLVLVWVVVGCSVTAPPTANNPTSNNTTPTVAPPSYTEVGSHMLNNCLVIEVSTTNQDEASRELIADDVIKKHGWNSMVRVFFYQPGQTPGTDAAIHRIERNTFDGQTRNY